MKKSTPTVSVVLATYNGERFLKQQLESYASQTVLPYELIVADDGSTDGTIDIVNNFVKKDAQFPVRIFINQTRLGYGANFLNASDFASGEVISFSDQDDIWLPNKLERSIIPFADAETVLTAHRATLINYKGEPIGRYDQNISKSETFLPGTLDPWGFFAGFTVAVRASLLRHLPWQCRTTDEDKIGFGAAHDRWVYFLASSFGRISVVPEYLALYRQHDANLYGGVSNRAMVKRFSEPLSTTRELAMIFQAIASHRVRLFSSPELKVDQFQRELVVEAWWTLGEYLP